MDKHPSRRKSKDNPYRISVSGGKYLISFKSNGKTVKEFEITKEVYEAFDKFELEDISQMHKDDYHRDLNHYDYTETADNYIFNNSVCEYKSVEETVEEKIRNEKLYQVINSLSEVQQRRIKLYYFKHLTLDEIANLERTTHQAISKSIRLALDEIRKKFKNWNFWVAKMLSNWVYSERKKYFHSQIFENWISVIKYILIIMSTLISSLDDKNLVINKCSYI